MQYYQDKIEENKVQMQRLKGADNKSIGDLFRENNRLQQRITFLNGKQGQLDRTASYELELYAENDGELYKSVLVHIHRNMTKRYKKNDFDLQKAAIAYKYFIDEAAKKYVKDQCSRGDDYTQIFNSVTRWDCAWSMAEGVLIELRAGNAWEK